MEGAQVQRLFFSVALLLMSGMAGAASKAVDGKTTVVVLGVDHASQLVARNDRPALLAAFLAHAKPDAICIERSPEAFARNDYYEFTYEVQDVVVPFARRNGIDLCPIDWEPPVEDARLGFGMDLGTAPELRPASGFQQFLSFPSPSHLTRDLFHADDAKNVERIAQWAATPAKRAKDDLPRRLYLYRTYLQAQRVAAAAKAHPGGTLVVVVGEFHKRDIEAILGDAADIRIVQPSSIGKPTEQQVRQQERREYRVAVASFNLLGVQSTTGNIDRAFVRETVHLLKAEQNSPEVRLLETRLDLLDARITPAVAVDRYRSIATDAGDARFTWTGVTDATRLDSYFDPFGNLTVRQRAVLETARELHRAGRGEEAAGLRKTLDSELGQRKQAQLAGYWERYIVPSAAP
jgi:hypothetical protein